MIRARRRSRQLAMNRIKVAMNNRNSVKVGDRNPTVGSTQSNLGNGNVAEDPASDTPTMVCNSCQSASGRSNTCIFSLSWDPSSGSRVLHSTNGDEINPIMKATPAPTEATISTADTARGIRCRSSTLAAGDSMVPTTNAATTGRKTALAAESTATTQMTRSATSTKATTSARRITGGCSALL